MLCCSLQLWVKQRSLSSDRTTWCTIQLSHLQHQPSDSNTSVPPWFWRQDRHITVDSRGPSACRCTCILWWLFWNAAGAKPLWNIPLLSLTGSKGGREGRGVEGCLREAQPARCRHTGDPWPHSIHPVQVSRKHRAHAIVKCDRVASHQPRTHLARFHFLQSCKTQVMLDKSGRHRERWFHLKLFCLSAPPQLLNADPYYTPATSWREGDGSGEGCGQGRRKLMRKWEEQHRALQRSKDRSNRRRGGLFFVFFFCLVWYNAPHNPRRSRFSDRRQLSFSTRHPLDVRSQRTILVPVCAPMSTFGCETRCGEAHGWHIVRKPWHRWPKQIMF